MSDNRFKDYPTKRIPSFDHKNSNEMPQSHTDYDEDDYEDYDDALEPEYDTKPMRRRREQPERSVSRNARSADYNQPERRQRRSQSAYYKDKPQSKSKTAFIGIYIGLLVLAVAACITVFVLVFQWISREAPNPGDLFEREPSVTDDANEPVRPAGRPDIRNITTMITGITSDPRGLTMLNLETMQTSELLLSEAAEISDARGNDMTFSELRIGQLLEVNYDARIPEITSVRENPRAWTRAERTNVHVNFDNSTIAVGHEAFEFNSQTLVLHRGERIPVGQIRAADSVTVVGIGSTAWMIQLDASSGSLQLSNTDEIINGRITIGNLHPLFLAEITGPIDVVEGPHRITVEGENIETFGQNVVIVPGQTLTFDLSVVEFSTATLTITTTPADANIFINNEPETSPAEVSFGEHTVRVQREGYITEERTINVTRAAETIRFNLEAVVLDARFTIFTTPTNAEVFVNNERIGNSNILLLIPPGSHNIMVRLDGHIDYSFSVNLSPGQETSRSITLTPIAVNVPDVPHIPDTPGDNNDSTGSPGLTIPPPPPPIPPAAP